MGQLWVGVRLATVDRLGGRRASACEIGRLRGTCGSAAPSVEEQSVLRSVFRPQRRPQLKTRNN